MSAIGSVYILGNHIQALGLSRMAARMGLHVTIFNNYGASVARFSNSCRRFILFRDAAHLRELLLDKREGKDTLLLATNDQLTGFMADHYEVLSRRYFLSIPHPSVVKICLNKRYTYRKAVDLGIAIPETHFPDSAVELLEIASHLDYPVILKPAVMYTFHRATGKKVFFCRNEKELIAYYWKILQFIPADEVIVQQFLNGGAKSLYSFGSFFASGKVYGGFVANRIRQKPMDFGVSTCFARTVINPEIERLATSFLKALDYFGMSEVEFMYDEAAGCFRLLEINPRAWKWHSISNKLNIRLLEMMVDHFELRDVEVKMNDKAGVGWIEPLTDTYVVLGELLRGRLSLAEYWKTLRMPKESAAWSLSDPLPALMYLIMAPYLLFKRN